MCSSEAEACGEAARLDMARISEVEGRRGLVGRFTQRVVDVGRDGVLSYFVGSGKVVAH